MARIDELEVVVRRKGSMTFASIPQLGLRAKGSDLSAAFEELEGKKKELVQDFTEEEIDALLGSGSTPSYTRHASAPSDLRGFFIKAGIVTALFVVGAMVASEVISSKIDASVDKVRYIADQYKSVFDVKIGGRQFWTKLETQLNRLADPSSDMPESQKAKLLADFRAVATRYRPFVAEVLAVFPPVPVAVTPATATATPANAAATPPNQ